MQEKWKKIPRILGTKNYLKSDPTLHFTKLSETAKNQEN